MSRIKLHPLEKPDERSSATSWTPFIVLGGVIAAVAGLVLLLKVIA